MTARDGAVEKWLQGEDDVASVCSGVSRAVGSEFGEFDERAYVLPEDELSVSGADVDEVRAVGGALDEVARAAQRKAVCGFYRAYVRGSMLQCPDYGHVEMRNQQFFRLENFMQLATLDDSTLVDQLMRGVVRSRLGAETGLGKTMKLPGLLASKCNIRVCQLELDTVVADIAMKYQKKQYGIPGSVRSWSRNKKAFLACMSYDEFQGIVLSGNRDRLFSDFDLFYMDEAHEPMASVWAARQYFAAFAQSHNSLLVTSATVSTLESNNAVSVKAGRFVQEPERVSLEQALDGGKLLAEHLRDRTQLLVASDEDVALARSYYLEQGLDVRVLDTASVKADVEAVSAWLSVPTAVVPRVLVCTENYGTAYNLPVSYVISTCTRRVYEMDEKHALIEKEIPLMAKSVVQHQGRASRGLATGGGGWLLAPQRSPDKELLTSEALSAYLGLVAAGIKPRPGMFDSVTKVLPKGINSGVARMLLRGSLPPAAMVRYLGSDGRFARKYANGVALFMQPGERLRPSKDDLPFGYDSWVEEEVGDYYVGDETRTSVKLRVPFECPVGLKVSMHAISAVAENLLDLDYWDWYDEDEKSDDEEVGIRTKVRRVAQPRMPVQLSQRDVASSVTTNFSPWSYDADPEAARRIRRKGISWTANGEGKAAITTLVRALDTGDFGTTVARPAIGMPEHPDEVAYSLPLEEDPMMPVRSAGGGKILLVAKSVHQAFMAGDALGKENGVSVVKLLLDGRLTERFAKSTVFDNWSPAWLCWFKTYAEEEVVKAWLDAGLHSEALKLLNFLYDRFRSEVISVASSSHLYKEKLGSFFRKRPSISRFVVSVRKGRVPLAQSDAFVLRVLAIKDAYDVAVLAVERVGLYAPSLVTSAQRKLPIRDKNRKLAVIDEAVVSNAGFTVEEMEGNVRWRG